MDSLNKLLLAWSELFFKDGVPVVGLVGVDRSCPPVTFALVRTRVFHVEVGVFPWCHDGGVTFFCRMDTRANADPCHDGGVFGEVASVHDLVPSHKCFSVGFENFFESEHEVILQGIDVFNAVFVFSNKCAVFWGVCPSGFVHFISTDVNVWAGEEG